MSIIKFEKPNCNPCKAVGEWLTQNNVEHEVINVFDRPDMARKYKIGTTVPVTLNTETGKMVRGFKPEELKQIILA